MIAQELLIGDFVFSKGKDIHTVQGLDEDENGRWWYYSPEHQAWCAVDEAQPIPLTPEILEKNGFESYSHESNLFWGIKIAEGYLVLTYMDYYWEFTIDTTIYIRIKIQYVHKLQHALRLCGIDKEIIL